MSLTWNDRPLNGCLFESQPVPAASVASSSRPQLPERVNLRDVCSPVEDQGQTNSCTANAIVGALEYLQRRDGHAVTDLSRMYVYYNARQLANQQDTDCGSYIHHVMAAVLAHGACEERMWPFQKAMTLVKPPESSYVNAMSYQAVQYGRAPLGPACLAAVASGLPIVFGTYIPKEYYDEGDRTGVMPAPGPELEAPGGGHAMLIVGYDAAARQWIVRNSWGTDFADGGYVRIPFETLEAYSRADHFWTLGALDQAKNLRLIASIPVPPPQEAEPIEFGAASERVAELKGDFREDLRSKLDSAKSDFRRRLRGSDS